MATFTELLVCSGSKKLVICFNSMACVGKDEKFELYNTMRTHFEDEFDILFVKDTEYEHWYLTIMQELTSFIRETSNRYTDVYAVANSSGGIPLLNIMTHVPTFRKAVIMNGQNTLNASIMNECSVYSDCAHFEEGRLKGPFEKSHLEPLERMGDGEWEVGA